MQSSLPATILALILLSAPASAHWHKGSCKNCPEIVYSTYTVLPMPVVTTPPTIQSTFTAIPMSLVAPPESYSQTFNAVPMPVETRVASISSTFGVSPVPKAATPASISSTFSAVPLKNLVTPVVYSSTFKELPMPVETKLASISSTFKVSPTPSVATPASISSTFSAVPIQNVVKPVSYSATFKESPMPSVATPASVSSTFSAVPMQNLVTPIIYSSTFKVSPTPNFATPASISSTFSAVPLQNLATPASYSSTFSENPMPVETTGPASISSTFSAVPLKNLVTPVSYSSTFAEIAMPTQLTPAIISSTFAASPIPTNTNSDSVLSHAVSTSSGNPTGTNVASGIFFTGGGSGGRTGGGGASTGVPFFTLQDPDFTSTSIPFFTLKDPIPTQAPVVSSGYQLNPPSTFVTFPAKPTKECNEEPPSVPYLKSRNDSSTSAPSSHPPTYPTIPFLRGINLGGWLVLEKWMNPDAFTGTFAAATDQYTFDSMQGAPSALEAHWDTFFTESDIQTLAATGLNALRIPIGFWAYDNADTPYLKGADEYLEKAIGWARKYGMFVWVDLHGSPGSQNGFDNSGQAGEVNWQQPANLARSISVLKIMAKKYGKLQYADVVVGLEMVNEPISWNNNKFNVTQAWAQDAYKAVKAEVQNQNLIIVMHDAFQGPGSWTDIGKKLNGDGPKTFGIDTHLYQLFTDADNALTQAEHITVACGQAQNLAAANEILPTYVAEWTAATNICVNPDGSTTNGTTCSVQGCQCQVAPFADWNDKMVEQTRRFIEAQLDFFESSTSGYFLWAAKAPGAWGFLNMISVGAFPNPVTERKYSGQCGGGRRRAGRGVLGRGGEAF